MGHDILKFKSRFVEYRKRTSGVDPTTAGKFLEDYDLFDPVSQG